MESKFKPLLVTNDMSKKAVDFKTATPTLTSKNTSEKTRDFDEKDKEHKSFKNIIPDTYIKRKT